MSGRLLGVELEEVGDDALLVAVEGDAVGGLYMLVFLGLLGQENMRIEGFRYSLFCDDDPLSTTFRGTELRRSASQSDFTTSCQ